METAGVTVSSVRLREVLVPFRRPLATRAGFFERAPILLVDLHTNEGVVGRVPAFGFHEQGPHLIGAAIGALAQDLIGRHISPGDLPQITEDLLNRFQLLGRQGIVRFAQSILDMVLHDAMARSADMPLYAALGAQPKSIRAYNSNGLGLASLDELAREAGELIDEGGFTHIKCRGGRESGRDDVDAVRTIRRAIPQNVSVSIDFNQHLTPSNAKERVLALDDLDLLWIEEPVPSDDTALSAELVDSLSTPIMMGENYYGFDSVKRASDARAFSQLMPDVLRIGGVSGWMHTAQFSAERGIEVSSHLSPEFSVHLLSATPTAGWLEYVDWGSDLIRDPLTVTSGFAVPPDRPGSGIEWNEDEVVRFLKSDRTVE
ncbi:hypothetical protein KX928_00980 [Roseobacter sp. YSTF-M11]|uniref:Mandelate racemase/muconate lactonizing enzyme C-terminal domain-containing protein n=1 Tax=Roseobacter insulae TaxID=2859783 RepID=A0A9X1FS33_9RHOB|nr:enolase C-terminal domain-like protein [Roseobacter insulae]MBW4706354.1 hypothetical protein [Roseobacter insulae]